MKKSILLLLLLAVLFLTGCSSSEQIGICVKQGTDGIAEEYLQCLEQAFTDAGYTVTTADAQSDQAVQTRQVKELIDQGCQLLVLEPVMMEQASALAQLAKQANVPVVFVGYEPDGAVLSDWDKLCYVGMQEDLVGVLQAQSLPLLPDGGDLNGDGTVSYVIAAGPEDHMDALSRTDSCMNAVQGTCLEVAYGPWSKESGQVNCSRLLATYGKDMEVIFCNSDAIAVGAINAIRDGGRTVGQDIYLVGMGGDRQSRLLIRSGDLSATVYPDLDGQTELVLKAAKQLFSGRKPEKQQYGEYILLTRENVENYIAD